MARGNQAIRQWRLLRLVSRPGGVAIDAAAHELGCAVRTVWRDLRVLQDAGLPLYDERAVDGRHGVWKVHASFHDRLPVPITLDEVVALLVSEKLLAPAIASPLAPAISSLIGKIRALLAPSAIDLIEKMSARVGVRALVAKLQAQVAEYLPDIQRALSEHRALRLRYFSMSRDAETDRRVDPYQLTHFSGGLYLVGYCHLRRAVRIFAVERIRALELLDATFTIPAGFDADAYLADAWGMIRGDLVTITAVFSRTVAPYVRERHWHPSQTLRNLGDGRLELTLSVADTIEVRRWLLGFGADAEVLAPASLREAMRLEVGRVVAMLSAPPDGARARAVGVKPLARAARRRRSIGAART